MWLGSRSVSRQAGQGSSRPAGDDQRHQRGARVWMVDGWGFSLGLGIGSLRDSRLRGGGETDQFQMSCCDWCECCAGRPAGARVCSNGHGHGMACHAGHCIVRSCVRVCLIIVLTAIDRRHGHYLRPAAQLARRAHSHASQSKDVEHFQVFQASGPRRMPRPPGTSCSHTHANETPSRYPATCTHVDTLPCSLFAPQDSHVATCLPCERTVVRH